MAYQSFSDFLRQKGSDIASPVMVPHTAALQGPSGIEATSPTQFDYHTRGTADLTTRISDALKKGGNFMSSFINPGANLASPLFDLSAPTIAGLATPFYDATQAYRRMPEGSGIAGFGKQYWDELTGTHGRFVGASAPLAERVKGWFDDDDETGTIAFDPNNPQVNLAGMIRRKKMMKDRRATQKGIAQVAMQKRIQEEERQRAAAAAAQAAAAQQVRQNIQTYGNRDRPNVGINRPGGGRGQSPTGGDVAGTPFYRGGLASLYG